MRLQITEMESIQKMLQDEMAVMVLDANKLATSGFYARAAASYTRAILASNCSNKIVPSLFVKRANCLARFDVCLICQQPISRADIPNEYFSYILFI